jgi:virginiamycin B lyase
MAKKVKIICQICGNPFLGRRDAKTCSPTCRKRLERQRSLKAKLIDEAKKLERTAETDLQQLAAMLLPRQVAYAPVEDTGGLDTNFGQPDPEPEVASRPIAVNEEGSGEQQIIPLAWWSSAAAAPTPGTVVTPVAETADIGQPDSLKTAGDSQNPDKRPSWLVRGLAWAVLVILLLLIPGFVVNFSRITNNHNKINQLDNTQQQQGRQQAGLGKRVGQLEVRVSALENKVQALKVATSDATLMGNSFNGANQLVQLTHSGDLPTLDGENLTDVNAITLGGNGPSYYTNASNINGGTLSDSRLSANVALLNGANVFTGTNIFNSTVTVANQLNANGGLTVGIPGATTGSLVLANANSSREVILQGLNPTGSGNATVQVPVIAGGSTDTVCLLTLGNCVGAGGAVSTIGGTQNYITKYNNAGANQLTNSQLFDNGTGVSIGNASPAGLFNVGATNQFQVSNSGAVTAVGLNGSSGLIQGTGGLTISGTTTLSSLNSAGVVHTNGSGVLSTSAVALGTDTSGSYVANLGGLTGLTTSGNSGAGSTPTLSVNYGSAANTAVQGNTSLTCASGTGNLSGGGNAITLGSGGSCGNINITNNPVFSGTLAVQGANALTLGTAFTNTGAIILQGSGGAGTLTLQGPTTPNAGNFTLSIPAITGNANLCTDNSVCAGYAASSGGNYIAKNTNDTSSASFAGNLLGLTNTNTGAAGVLSLTNGGTNSALSILQSGTSEPSAGQALILANNNTTTPTGNLIDLQNKGTSKLTVDVSGNLTAVGTLNGATISGGTLTASAVNSLNVSGTAISGTSALTIDANGANTISLGGTSTGDILLGGGSGSTGCTVTNASGNLTCTGNITGAATGTMGYWSRAGTTLQPATAGDAITTSGNISTSGSGTITAAGILNANATGQTAISIADSGAQNSGITIGTDTSLFRSAAGTLNLQGTGSTVTLQAAATAGTDVTGTNLTLAAGTGTGAGSGGNLNFQVAPPSSTPNQSFITGASTPYGVAINSSFIYWANSTLNTIGRANLDGSSPNQSFITGANSPKGIAVDGSFIYWTNQTGNTIGRANLDGSSPNQSFITSLSAPTGIAINGSFIYWVNLGTNTIGRANLDGSSPNQSFITGATVPRGMAVNGSFIYWANSTLNTIGRANLDGSSPNQSFITGANSPSGIAVNGSFIYWVNLGTNTIARANLDGSSPNQSFITGANAPWGIAVNGSFIYWTNQTGNTIGRVAFGGAVADTPVTVASLMGSNGAALFQNAANSTTAFQIQNAANSSNLFVADTLNARIGIGAAPANGTLTVGTNTTTASGGIYFGTDTNLYRVASNDLKTDGSFDVGCATLTFKFCVTAGNSTAAAAINQGSTGNILQLTNNAGATIVASVGSTGNTLFENSANSTTAFQVQNAGGTQLVSVDTSTTPNMISNGGFEVNTTGWTPKGNASLSRDTANQYEGNASLLITTTANAGDGASFNVTLSPNTTYTIGLVSKSSTTTANSLVIGRQDISGTDVNSCTSSQFQVWLYTSCSFTTGPTITSSNIFVKQTDATARSIWLDAVQLQTTSQATPYQNGLLQLNGVISSPVAVKTSQPSTRSFAVYNSTGSTAELTIDNINDRVGIHQGGTSNPQNTLSVNVLTTQESTAQVAIGTRATTNQGLLIQGVASQTANLMELQSSNGTILSKFDANGILGGANGSGTDAAGSALTLAGGQSTGLGSGGNINFQISKPAGGTGSGTNALSTVASINGTTGAALFQNAADSTTALQIQNAAGTSNLFVADTVNNRVGIGTSSAQVPLQVVGNTEVDGKLSTPSGGFGTYSNLFQYSEQLDQSGMWVGGGGAAVTANAIAAPDGQTTADSINYTTTTGSNFIGQTYNTGSAMGGRTFTFSVWMKANSINTADLQMRTSPTSGADTTTQHYILSNNWQRYTMTKTFAGGDTDTSIQVLIRSTSVTGSFYAWGAQLEEAGTAGPYVPTTTGINATATTGLVVGSQSALFRNDANSTTAFQIQNAAGTSLLIADTTNGAIGLGITPTAGLGVFQLAAGTTAAGGINFGDSTANLYRSASGTLKTDGSLAVQGAVTVTGNLVANGAATFKDLSNSTTAFQILDSGNTNVATADTTTDTLTVNNLSVTGTCTGCGSAGTVSLQSAYTTGSTITTTNANNITFNLANTATPAKFIIQNPAGTNNSDNIFSLSGVYNANNKVTNGSFEVDTTGWAATSNVAISQDATQGAPYGSSDLKIVSSGPPVALNGAKYTVNMTNNTVYSLSFYAKTAAAFATMTMGWSNDGTNNLTTGCSLINTPTTTTWLRFNCVFTYTGTTNNGVSDVFIGQNDATARTWYVDGVSLEQIASNSFYKEGTLNLNGLALGNTLIQPAANSNEAFRVAAVNGTNGLEIDTSGSTLTTGFAATFNSTLTATSTFVASATSTTEFRVRNASTVTNLINADTSTINNISTNGGVENGVTGYAANGAHATTTQDATAGNAYMGLDTLKTVTTASVTANEGSKFTTTAALFPVNSNPGYTLSFYAKLPAGAAAFTTLVAGRAEDGATNTTCTLNSTIVTTYWQRFTCHFTTATSSGPPYIFFGQSDAGVAHTYFIDSVQLISGGAPKNYGEGLLQFNGPITSPSIFQNQSDSTSAFQIQNAGLTTMLLNADTATTKLSVTGQLAVTGGLSTTGLAVPSAPTVTPTGTTGSTNYSYAISALNANGGSTLVSTATQTTTGNATLTGGNFNAITWTSVPGASSYNIYRTASSGTPSTTGLIGNVLVTSALTFSDTGIAGGAAQGTIDNSGQLVATGTVLFKNAANSTAAFQVQNAAGSTTVFNVDTQNGRVGIGTSVPGNLLSIGALTTADGAAQLAVSTGGTGNKGIVIQAVASQSADILDVEDSGGNVLFGISNTGHIITGGGALPAATPQTPADGTTGTCTVAGNDSAGTVTITPAGSGIAAGTVCQVNFTTAFGSAPRPVIAPTNGAASAIQAYVSASTTGSFTVSFNAVPSAQAYTFNWFSPQ